MGWVQFFLGESRSRLYPHMRAKFGRDPTAGSKKVSFKFIIGYNNNNNIGVAHNSPSCRSQKHTKPDS